MTPELPRGVMFNAYPDSIGRRLADTVAMLSRPEFQDAFSLFYILPTFFNSDLDRGFSIIDYDINREFAGDGDLAAMGAQGIALKFDLVVNHLSVGSPQFQDMLSQGDDSAYRDFFIDWNLFWKDKGAMGPDGYLIPDQEYLDVLFMRKPGFPVLKARFPDGTERPYWNTFYQEISYPELVPEDLHGIAGLPDEQAAAMLQIANEAIRNKEPIEDIDWGPYDAAHAGAVVDVIERNRHYLGQMDLNARSEKVWEYFDETLAKLRDYGARLVRLDAFAYLHKEAGKANFFNEPGTWEYLDRLKQIARKYDLILLPELHTEYGYGLHEEMAGQGFPIYDFFFPGLLIDALDRGTNRHLLRWIRELVEKEMKTINMLGCHDGIPVLDLRGRDIGISREGLLSDAEIDATIDRIIARGGRVKNLYGPDGRKIAYYQINASYFSALGEDERKLRLARAIQMFMPGIPQVWYLDLFAGKNDYVAADEGGTAGHKEINRTTLSLTHIEHGLKQIVVQDQLQLIKLRNNSSAFYGELNIADTAEDRLEMTWSNGGSRATLQANLLDFSFTVNHVDESGAEAALSYR